MKNRNGFVSNSSSSSFIVTCARDEEPVLTVSMSITAKELAEYTITNEWELKTFFNDEYGPGWENENDVDSLKNKYNDMLRVIEKYNKKIYVCHVSSYGEPIEEYLYNCGIEGMELSSGVASEIY